MTTENKPLTAAFQNFTTMTGDVPAAASAMADMAKPKEPRGRRVTDPETIAIAEVVEIVEGLPEPARSRVVAFAMARFVK